jgi:multiple sugar transport system permease protein
MQGTITSYHRRRIVFRIILYIVLGIGGFIMIYPFLWMIINSFRSSFNLMTAPLTVFDPAASLENYIMVFGRLKLGRAFLNSVIVSTIITVFVLFTSSISGFLFAKFRFKGKEALFMYVLGTLMAPIYVILIPLFRLVSAMGLLDTLAAIFVPFLIHAFGIFLMRQFIAGIPDSLIDAARIDGASDFGIYVRLILPLTMPALSVLGILIFLWSWDELLWPLVVVHSDATKTIPVWLTVFTQAEAKLPGPSLAASTVVIIPVLIVYFFFQRNFIKGMTMTGLKY